MDLNEYQKRAMVTKMPSCDNESYMLINLMGEVGELASKYAKAIRKEQIAIEGNKAFCKAITADERAVFEANIKSELGDVLWMVAGLADVAGMSLNEVARYNLQKLADRQRRNKIVGDGDFR